MCVCVCVSCVFCLCERVHVWVACVLPVVCVCYVCSL